ncbi:MAG TPA: flavin reductase family protein [Microthrixaceae bacterium]|nr:flavin reductase family protein [Microthrixaceae bacterium]
MIELFRHFDRFDGGDHDIVIGRVQGLGVDRDEDGPLLFFKGKYGKLAPLG